MRQFVLEKQIVKNGILTLDGKDFKYLSQVLRVKSGDMLNVRFQDGTLHNFTVAKIEKNTRTVTLQICAESSFTEENNSITRGVQASEFDQKLPEIEYWLFQFIPKPVKFEQIVRQATECGISVIVPIIGEYSEKSSIQALEGSKKERLERIIKEARQQSGSPVNTTVLTPLNLEKAIELWQGQSDNLNNASKITQIGFVLSERDDCKENLRDIIEKSSDIKKVGIAVGCEGGISPSEVKLLQEKGGFFPIHFNVNILRCETAALYGIAAVQSAI